MAVNKVVYGKDTLLDLTGDTVTAEDVAEGLTFHAADGTKQVGTRSNTPEGCVKGTATHTRTGGMTLTGLLAPPQMIIIWNWNTLGSYGSIAFAAGWNGSGYTYKYGADLDGYKNETYEEYPPTVTYSDGTLNIKTGISRFNGSPWNYMYVY